MEYSDFCRLVQGGEKATVDFKLQSKVFNNGGTGEKGEFAKDICAMANNGNMASYILIGISDDRKIFKSASNETLTDDNLQDFCKKAIYPPPKVRLSHHFWSRAHPDHRGKRFIIIQVGPQPRQVFRLAQDFIDYKQRVCFRRNEVWIRRNATTDLATPEEITRIATGGSLQEEKLDPRKEQERLAFSRASSSEQSAIISLATHEMFLKNGYTRIREEDWANPREGFRRLSDRIFYKRHNKIAMLAFTFPCWDTFRIPDLRLYKTMFGCLQDNFLAWSGLPRQITERPKSNITGVRLIWYLPVIKSVSTSKIRKIFSRYREIGPILYFYTPDLVSAPDNMLKRNPEVTSSSELVIIDKIQSRSDYLELLNRALNYVETERETLVKPERDAAIRRRRK